MRAIQMVDLVAQYHDIKKEVDKAVVNVMESAAFIKGPEVKAFEEELENYLNVKHVIPCANGTDALQIALMALGLKPGDEVISVDFTFAATVEVIGLLQLEPVLVDVDPETFNMDIDRLKEAITPNTKAIVPVHMFGQCANIEEILAVAKEHNLFVVEDTAQAIGAEYTFSNGEVKKAGTMGHIGTTSFFPSKNLGCFGDGGAIFTNDDELASNIEAIANHGMRTRYLYDEIGVNSRLDSMQAAILRIKLRRLDQYSAARNEAAKKYNDAFANEESIVTPVIKENSTHVFHQYTMKITNGKRDELQKYLAENNIPSMIYYPYPLHEQKAYKVYTFDSSKLGVTKELCKQVISLPMHTELSDDQIEYITSHVKKFLNK